MHDTSINPFIRNGDGSELGDPMPVYWDGVWHLYGMSADAGRVVHFTSTDLVRWVEHKPAMVGQDIATGTVLRHENKYYLFYTDADPQTIRLVVSDNNMEAFVDGRECLSARVVDRSCYKVAIEIAGGPATIRKPFVHYFRNGG